MIETKQHEGSYALHPVVQDWCLHIANTGNRMISTKLDELALICVGYSAPSTSERNWLEIHDALFHMRITYVAGSGGMTILQHGEHASV
jgi:hypothetical protein